MRSRLWSNKLSGGVYDAAILQLTTAQNVVCRRLSRPVWRQTVPWLCAVACVVLTVVATVWSNNHELPAALPSRTTLSAVTGGLQSMSMQFDGRHLLQKSNNPDQGHRCADEYSCPFIPDARSFGGLTVIFIGSCFASAVGVGGGALYVPIFNVIIGFGLKASTSLSQAVIMGGAVMGVLINLFQHHPKNPSLPLIDFPLALMLIPMLLFGTNLGVLLNVALPTWLMTIFLSLLLCYLAYKPFVRGIKMWRTEAQRIAQREAMRRASMQRAAQRRTDDSTATTTSTHGGLRSAAMDGASTPVSERIPVSAFSGGDGGEKNFTDSMRQRVVMNSPDVSQSKKPRLHPSTSLKLAQHEGSASKERKPVVKIRTCEDIMGMRVSNRSFSGAIDLDPPELSHLGDAPLTSDDIKTSSHGTEATSSGHSDDAAAPAMVAMEVDRSTQSSDTRLRDRLPIVEACEMMVLWGIMAVLQWLKGVAKRCTAAYWCVWAAQFAAALIGTAVFISQAVRRHRADESRRDLAPFLAEDDGTDTVPMKYTYAALSKTASITLMGGLIAGLTGIGGGMVLGPLMLELGVNPQVTAATSAVMVLFSSSMAVFNFATIGRLNPHYALIYSAAALVASLAGVVMVTRIVRRTGRPSIIVLVLACIIASGALMSAVFGGFALKRDFTSGQSIGFHNICVVS